MNNDDMVNYVVLPAIYGLVLGGLIGSLISLLTNELSNAIVLLTFFNITVYSWAHYKIAPAVFDILGLSNEKN